MNVGETATVTCTISGFGTASPSWSITSSGECISFVGETIGKGTITVKADAAGTATIKCTAGSASATCTVTVNTVAVTGVTLNKSSLALNIGDEETLDSSSFSDGTLTLNFVTADAIEAGKPYLVKVTEAAEIGAFDAATVSSETTPATTDYADFVPALDPVSMTAGDKNILFVSNGTTLTYPSVDGNLNGFRAYFQLHDIDAAALARLRHELRRRRDHGHQVN